MSTHDKVIANDTFPNLRADVNVAIAAIASQESGTADPPAMLSYERQARTDLGVVRRRNAANAGWVIDGTLAEAFVLSRSSNTIISLANFNTVIKATATFTQTFSAAATLSDGWRVDYIVDSGATITFDPNASETIDGSATKVVVGPAAGVIFSNGVNLFTSGFVSASGGAAASETVSGIAELATQVETDAGTDDLRIITPLKFRTAKRIIMATEQVTTSGTSIDFTGIPTGVRRITINPVAMSSSGTSLWILQLGDSGGIENTLYNSLVREIPSLNGSVPTTGFGLNVTVAAGHVRRGSIFLNLEDAADFTWSITSVLCEIATLSSIEIGSGSKSLSAELDRIRLTTVGGTETLDAGVMNISYER